MAALSGIKDRLDATVKTAVYGSIAASAAVVAFAFGCIALFFWAQQRYDTIVAASILGGLFLLIVILAVIGIAVARRRAAKAEERESQVPQWLSDPATILAGVQVVRTVGLGRLLPILVIGAVAAAVMAGSNKRRPGRSQGAAPQRRAA